MIDAGARVALATNCNPGSSYTTSMSFCIALAVRDMHMTPEEAIAAATTGGAAALRRDDVGRIAPGARADLVVLDAPSYTYLVYRPGVPLVRTTIEAGDVDLIFNTPHGAVSTEGAPRADGYEIRTAAVRHNVPCITTVQGLGAAVQGIEARIRGDIGVRSLQDWARELRR